jgi:23S rRNA (cytidine1920-2'-O)/16S rRNA (cytidine1409-2'-O)-methyltransferase
MDDRSKRAGLKKRADQLLVERGLADSRARARALIEAGLVTLDASPIDKPGRLIAPEAAIALSAPDHVWASRAGLKLVAALDHFGIDPKGETALDIGASTGGFTDVLLARGAARVYAVDVGHDQLVARLRADPRVIVLERLNARELTGAEVPEPVGIVTCDASFIGLETVLPAPLTLAAPGARLVALVKPQFEVGPGRVGKGGIVRDPVLHREVCGRIESWLGQLPGWHVLDLTPSPIAGGDGNLEFLIAAEYRP